MSKTVPGAETVEAGYFVGPATGCGMIQAGAACSWRRISGSWMQGLGDGVEALEQAVALGFGDLEAESGLGSRCGIPGAMERDGLVAEVDRHLGLARVLPPGRGDGVASRPARAR